MVYRLYLSLFIFSFTSAGRRFMAEMEVNVVLVFSWTLKCVVCRPLFCFEGRDVIHYSTQPQLSTIQSLPTSFYFKMMNKTGTLLVLTGPQLLL